MARRRYISTEISVDSRIAKLAEKHGDFAALLYTWMIPHAADDCSITSEPDELLMLVVPGLRSKTCGDVTRAIEGMIELGLVFEEGDSLVFPPEAFYRYQTYINANNRRTPQNAEKRRESAEIAVSPPPSLSLTPSLSPSPLVVVGARDDDEVGKILASFATFGTVNEYTPTCVEEAIETYTADWVKRAVKVAGTSKASGDRPPWNYVEQTLQRWKKRGEPDDDKGKEPVAVGAPKKSLRYSS
jgi:hypothetical protein